MKLSVLEFGLRNERAGGPETLQEVIEYACKADQLGFHRLWFTEHHNLSPAWNSPDIILPIVAGMTKRIRIGIGGVLLSIHSPYRVALHYKLLAALFPDRIDLGIANSQVAFDIAKCALDNELLAENYTGRFFEKFKQLDDFLHDTYHGKYEHVVITPQNTIPPTVWSLGSSHSSLPHLVKLRNLNFSLSVFHRNMSLEACREIIDKTRDTYYNEYGQTPQINIALTGICASSKKAAAQKFAATGNKEDGYPYNCIVGTAETFFQKLSEYAEKLGIDEFIFNDLSRNNEDRLAALKALSKKFNLGKS